MRLHRRSRVPCWRLENYRLLAGAKLSGERFKARYKNAGPEWGQLGDAGDAGTDGDAGTGGTIAYFQGCPLIYRTGNAPSVTLLSRNMQANVSRLAPVWQDTTPPGPALQLACPPECP